MFNSKKPQTNQKPKIFHNYNLSTKKVDGTLLYNLFLANQKPGSPGLRLKSKDQDRKTKYCKLIHETKKQVHSTQLNTPFALKDKQISLYSNKLLTMSQENEKNQEVHQPQNISSIKRNCISGNSFYSEMYESVKMKYRKIQSDKESILKKNETLKRKLRPSILRVSTKNIKAQDFIQVETFNNDILQQGKLNGLSAESITIFQNNKKIYQFQGDRPKEIASLTKIMTCIVSLFLAKKYQINIYEKQIKISRKASLITGTSAHLKIGDTLTIYDLLYGMMLPSGNDAAYALAQFFGKIVQEKKKQEEAKKIKKRQENQDTQIKPIIQPYDYFIKEMNSLASHLKMRNTNFNNPHGLSDKKNKSTSNDIAQLCYYAMKNQIFQKIVKTKEYELKIYNSQQKMKRQQKWVNTNKLLSLEHCEGIKTGVTPAAGPCMTAYFNSQGFSAIIVILNSKSKSSRFFEVKKLYEWAKSQIGR